MCDYSLQSVKTRDAAIEDKLVVHNFGTGTKGFADPDHIGLTPSGATAICLRPGTELAFEEPIRAIVPGFFDQTADVDHKTAIFRQLNKEQERMHHDALELPDGQLIMLTNLYEGQRAKVLQLPAAPKTEAEAKEQERVVYAG